MLFTLLMSDVKEIQCIFNLITFFESITELNQMNGKKEEEQDALVLEKIITSPFIA